MKAGIYYNREGQMHVYVRKDRSIAAIRYRDGKVVPSLTGSWMAATSQKEQVITCSALFDGTAERVSDVPNGCTEPEDFLAKVGDERDLTEAVLTSEQTAALATAANNLAEHMEAVIAARQHAVLRPSQLPKWPHFGAAVTGRPMPKAMKRHGAKGAIAANEAEARALQQIERGEIRLIGKQSKRKHRKAGHAVFWCAPLKSWAWLVQNNFALDC